MTRSTSKVLVAWRQWCRLILLVEHHILSYMYNLHRQMIHLRQLFERNTRPLPDTLLVGYITRNRRFLVAPGRDGTEVGLFSKPEPIPTEPEDIEGGPDEEEDPQFRAYPPPAHMHNVDLSTDDALEFPDLPHRTRNHTSSLLDSSEFEVGKGFSNKDSFLGALKQHSINNGVNYHVVKSKSDKFKAKCAVQDRSCSWKIYTSLRKKTRLYFTRSSQDGFSYDFSASLNCQYSNQMGYTPSYRKAWIAKQKALEKMHSWWDASYNEIWQWCQVLERYVTGCITDLQTEPAYYNDRLLRGCQGGHVWCAKVLQEINKAKARANTMHTVCHDQDNLWFRVTEFDKLHQGITGGQYRVHLRNRTCDCGRFDAFRYPCAHVIAACQNLRLDPMSYVDDVYKLEYMYNVWRHIFPPVPDERKWPSVSIAPFKLLPDRELRHKPKGRPCSIRIRNNMDIRETTNQQKLCRWCRNPGHTSRSCPNRNS
ncbi:hypothetical protein GOBAR_AA18423 [Gossypium barbadense]|uniref:SWIM-type domain-containing protein n=1 Tax=Gossypium barbadense TaxID=3634 RepID=A0A2P5XFV5_GOSBA|nr:hypothetical protein GOBAR_AA18423 [Gossypium barbadense]